VIGHFICSRTKVVPSPIRQLRDGFRTQPMKASLRRAFLLVSVAAACSEFAPVNQNDARYEMSVAIVGPDTVPSFGDTIQLSLDTKPEWTSGPPKWTVIPANAVAWVGNGRFVSPVKTYAAQKIVIVVNLGLHFARDTMYLRDVGAQIRFQYPGDSTYVDTTYSYLNGAWSRLAPVLLDSAGAGVVLSGGGTITLVSRDPTVAIPWSPQIRPLKSGQTWFVASIDKVIDSALVIVP